LPIYTYPGLESMSSLHLDCLFASGDRIVLEHFAFAGGVEKNDDYYTIVLGWRAKCKLKMTRDLQLG